MLHGRFSLHPIGPAWRLLDAETGFVFGDFGNPDEASVFANWAKDQDRATLSATLRDGGSSRPDIPPKLTTPIERSEAISYAMDWINALTWLVDACESGVQDEVRKEARHGRNVLDDVYDDPES